MTQDLWKIISKHVLFSCLQRIVRLHHNINSFYPSFFIITLDPYFHLEFIYSLLSFTPRTKKISTENASKLLPDSLWRKRLT